MTTTQRLASISFWLSLSGLIAAAGLFALIYFQCLPNTSYLWCVFIVVLCQVPALAMSIPARMHPLGRAALALSTSILVGMIAGILLATPISSERSPEDSTAPAQEVHSGLRPQVEKRHPFVGDPIHHA